MGYRTYCTVVRYSRTKLKTSAANPWSQCDLMHSDFITLTEAILKFVQGACCIVWSDQKPSSDIHYRLSNSGHDIYQ